MPRTKDLAGEFLRRAESANLGMGGTKDLVFKEPKEPVHLARTARMNDPRFGLNINNNINDPNMIRTDRGNEYPTGLLGEN